MLLKSPRKTKHFIPTPRLLWESMHVFAQKLRSPAELRDDPALANAMRSIGVEAVGSAFAGALIEQHRAEHDRPEDTSSAGVDRRKPQHNHPRYAEYLVVATFFTALSLAWLWPLPASLGSGVAKAPYWWDSELTAYIIGEMRENIWRIAERPLEFLELRILHPQGDVGALSENLLAPALLSLPLGSLLSPIALHNGLLILGLAATGVAMYGYLRRRVRRRSSALTGAILFTYAPIKLMLLARIQYTWTQFIPVLFLLLELFLRAPRARMAAALAWTWLLQFTTCVYLALHFLVLALPISLAFVPRCWRALRRRELVGLIPALLPVLVLVAAISMPYARVARDLGLSRDPQTIAAYSGRWADLLKPSDLGLVWGHWAQPVDQGSGREPVCFPGALSLFLGALGIVSIFWRRRRPASEDVLFGHKTHLALLALSVLLFLGTGEDAPRAPFSPFGWLQSLPGLHGMRYSSRFAIHVSFALSVFSGWAVDEILDRIRLPAKSLSHFAPTGFILLAIVDTWTKSLPLVACPQPEAIYRILRADNSAQAILETPFDGNLHEPRIVRNLAVLSHRLPTLGGYTGFDPPIWHYVRDQLAGFPDETSRGLLVETGVNRVVVHRHEAPWLSPDRLARYPWLTEIVSDSQHAILRVEGVERSRAAAIRRSTDDFPRALPASLVPTESMRLMAANPIWAQDLDAMLDRNPETRWTTMRPRRTEPWFSIEFAKPTSVSALWFDTRKSPLDGPSALEVSGLLENGSWVTLLAERAHACVHRLATAPATSYDVHRFPRMTVKALKVSHLGESNYYWGSIYELYVEQ